MLRKPLSLLSPDHINEVYARAKAYYSADDALSALVDAQEQFRNAVSTGAFPAERVDAMLHELEDMRDTHFAATQVLFESFQTAAFLALEQAMTPGFRNEYIDLTARTEPAPEHVQAYRTHCYARLDVHRERLGPGRRGEFILYVGENPLAYAGPDIRAGRQPSQCRSHQFVAGPVLAQSWDWKHAGV
jgi:hypothetical protein